MIRRLKYSSLEAKPKRKREDLSLDRLQERTQKTLWFCRADQGSDPRAPAPDHSGAFLSVSQTVQQISVVFQHFSQDQNQFCHTWKRLNSRSLKMSPKKNKNIATVLTKQHKSVTRSAGGQISHGSSYCFLPKITPKISESGPALSRRRHRGRQERRLFMMMTIRGRRPEYLP